MKVLQAIVGIPKAAGTSVFCAELSNALAVTGQDVTIAVVNPLDGDRYLIDPRVKLVAIADLFHSVSAQRSHPAFDLVHIHALWSPVLHRVARWARASGLPVVWSPHGMITPWAMNNKRLKKLLGWYLYQKKDLECAALLHATAESEVDDIRRMGLRNPIVVAPLGVRIVRDERVKKDGGKRTLLFVSRVQRKKGLPNLVEAWSRMPKEIRNGWQVRIVGPDQDNHTSELKEKCELAGVRGEFDFVGPKFGNELAAEYAAADLFVLPTHSENFGAVVIESLARGVPVICTKGAPWKELETVRCGRWIDIGVEPLVSALTELMSLSDAERHEMGARGRELAEKKYSWPAVCQKMVEGYERLRTAET